MVADGPSTANIQHQQQAPPKRHDPRTLTNLPDILSCLAELQSEETELSSSLTELLNARDPIVNSLSRLQSLLPELDGLRLEASLLTDKVSNTAKTAGRVGGKVRSLDEEMGRVREAGDRVGQVMELKVTFNHLDFGVLTLYSVVLQSSLAALQSSIESQDWESATRHCAKAMSLPLEVTSGPFAESAVVGLASPSYTFRASPIHTAYFRKPSTSCTDATNGQEKSPCHIPAELQRSLSIPGFHCN